MDYAYAKCLKAFTTTNIKKQEDFQSVRELDLKVNIIQFHCTKATQKRSTL